MQSIDFQARRKRVAQHARELGFDAYLGTRQGALHYLSGAFMPWRGAVLVTADGHCEFIYWAMDASRVRAEGHEMEMYEFEFSDFPQLIRQRLEHHGLTRGKVALDLSHPGAARARAALDGSRGFLCHEALDAIVQTVGRANQFIQDRKPWALAKDPANRAELEWVLASLIRRLARQAAYLSPFMPEKAEALWSAIGGPGRASAQRFETLDRIEGDKAVLDCTADKARERWRDESRSRALFEREDQGSAGPHMLDRSFSGTYR